MGCCTTKEAIIAAKSVVVAEAAPAGEEVLKPLKITYREVELEGGEKTYLGYNPKVYEFRARYKQFEYNMT